METKTLFHKAGGIIIVNECDVKKYLTLGFSESSAKEVPAEVEKAPAKPVKTTARTKKV